MNSADSRGAVDSQGAVDSISAQVETQYAANKLPPVDQWNPELSGDMDLVICRNGTWLHEGDPILRPKLVNLFASILKREDDDFYLVTPVEKWRIKVEDAPFLVESMEVKTTPTGTAIVLISRAGGAVVLSTEHPLWVNIDPLSGEPSPYVSVRGNLDALINRNVFYELVELAVEKDGRCIVQSQGEEFSLGEC